MADDSYCTYAHIDKNGTLTVTVYDNLPYDVKRVTVMTTANRKTTFYPDGDGE